MKTFLFLFAYCISLLISAQNLNGAWINKNDQSTILILVKDNYFTRTVFTPTEFVESVGGIFETKDDQIRINLEFDTALNQLGTFDLEYELNGDVLTIDYLKFQRADNGSAPLAGVWQISGRNDEDGNFTEIKHTGSRKTLKLLTGTYFQWFAIDPGKKKFYGTGGGTYTFKDGKYTENIEFFSRDNSRVGASLYFDDKIENDKWIHTGLSSKGEPLNEVWQKIE